MDNWVLLVSNADTGWWWNQFFSVIRIIGSDSKMSCLSNCHGVGIVWQDLGEDLVFMRKTENGYYHTMDLLWEKFQWILPLYKKPINFQSKASNVFFSHRSHIYWFLPEETKCVFPTYRLKKNKWISHFRWTNPQELKCWSTFYVSYFLRYYLMMQHQLIAKRVNGTHEWAHRPYQLLSAPYHCWLYKHRRQDEGQPLQSSWPVPICT